MDKGVLAFIIAIIIILIISFIIIEISLKDNNDPNLIIQPTPAKNPPSNTNGGNTNTNDQTIQDNNFMLNQYYEDEIQPKDIIFDSDSGKSCIFIGDLNGSNTLYSPFYGYFYEREINGSKININIDAITVDISREDVLYIHVCSLYLSGIYRLNTYNSDKGWELLISTGSNINLGIINSNEKLDKCIESKITDLSFDYDTLYITTPSIIYKYRDGDNKLEIYRYNNKSTLGFDIVNNNTVSMNIDSEILYNNKNISSSETRGLRRSSFIKYLDNSHFIYINDEYYIVSNSYDEKKFSIDYIKSFNCLNNNIVMIQETGEVNLIKQNRFNKVSETKFRDEIKVNSNHVVVGIGKEKFYIISTYTEGSTDENWYCN